MDTMINYNLFLEFFHSTEKMHFFTLIEMSLLTILQNQKLLLKNFIREQKELMYLLSPNKKIQVYPI